MLVVGVDFSVSQSGLSVLEPKEDNFNLICYGKLTQEFVVEYSKDLVISTEYRFEQERLYDYKDGNRLLNIMFQLENYLTLHPQKLLLVLEDTYLKLNPKMFKDSCVFQGILLKWAEDKGHSFISLHATSWRKGKILKRKRVDQKQEAIDLVNSKYGLRLDYHQNKQKSYDDCAEAILLAEAGYEQWNKKEQ
jgi:hypothetical protein